MKFLLRWGRTANSSIAVTQPEGVPVSIGGPGSSYTCVWHAGVLTNRDALAQRLDLSKATPTAELFALLYRRYGTTAATLAEGSLTWVVWDKSEKRLAVIGDRLGLHRLYYRLSGDALTLSDRLEALLDPHPPPPNHRSIVAHIHARPPAPGETYYQGISVLRPGELLDITPGTCRPVRYWRIAAQPLLKLRDDREYADCFRELLFRVVPAYMPDRRAAVALSSGMDSTCIAAAIKTVNPTADLVACTWQVQALPEADESVYAAAVAKHLRLTPMTIDVVRHWPLSRNGVVSTFRATPVYNLYADIWEAIFHQMSHIGADVLFTGLGGDHLFGDNVFAYPDLLLKGRWFELARQLSAHRPISRMSLGRVLRTMMLAPILRGYVPGWQQLRQSPQPWLTKVHRPQFRETLPQLDIPRRISPGRQQRLGALQDPFLPHAADLMMRQAEAHQIELRHPLLDHRLVEFAASLPTTQTFRAGERKIVVRNAMKGYLPDCVLNLRHKIEPTAIAHTVLREHNRDWILDLSTGMRLAELGYVDEACFRETTSGYVEKKHNYMHFWHTLTLEDWLRRHF